MFENIVKNLLEKYLGEYIEGIDVNQLGIGVLSGNFELKDLKLKKGAFDFLDLPIDVKIGFIGKLSASISWRKITSTPTKVLLEDIFAIVSPHQGNKEKKLPSKEEIAEKIKQTLQAKLDNLATWEMVRYAYDTEGGDRSKNSSVGMAEKIVDNLQVEINRVHIRYEDDRNKDDKFSIGIGIKSLESYTVDKKGERKYVVSAETAYKKVELRDFSIYFNKRGKYQQDEVKFCDKDMKLMYNLFDDKYKDDWEYILPPLSANMNVIMNKQNVAPKIRASIDLESIGITLRKKQYDTTMRLLSYFSEVQDDDESKKNKESENKSDEPDETQRNKYVSLYKKKFEGYPEPLNEDELIALTQMEHELPYSHVIHFRLVSEKLASIETKKPLDQIQFRKPEKKGYFGGWFSKKKTVVEIASLSLKEQDQIMDAVNFDPSQNEKKSDLEPSFVTLRVDFALEKMFLNLIQYQETLIELSGSATSLTFLQRPDSFALDISLHSMEMEDHLCKHTEYPTIVRVIPNEDNHKPLVWLSYESNPLKKKHLDSDLTLVTRPLEIVYNQTTIDGISNFFSTPADITLDTLSGVAWDTIGSLQEATQEKLKSALNERTKNAMRLTLHAPTIIIPVDPKNRYEDVLILDLGVLRVSTRFHDDEDKDEDDGEVHFDRKYYDRMIIKAQDINAFMCPGQKYARKHFNKVTDADNIIQPFTIRIDFNNCISDVIEHAGMVLLVELSDLDMELSNQNYIQLMNIVNIFSGGDSGPVIEEIKEEKEEEKKKDEETEAKLAKTKSLKEKILENEAEIKYKQVTLDCRVTLNKISMFLRHAEKDGRNNYPLIEANIKNLRLGLTQRQYDMALEVHLGDLEVLDKLTEHGNRYILSTIGHDKIRKDEGKEVKKAMDNAKKFISVSFISIDRKSPEYKDIDQDIDVKVGSAVLHIHRDTSVQVTMTVLNKFLAAAGGSDEEAKKKEEEELEKKKKELAKKKKEKDQKEEEVEGKQVTAPKHKDEKELDILMMKVRASFESFNLHLHSGGKDISSVAIQHFAVSYDQYLYVTSITAGLGAIVVEDKLVANPANKYIVNTLANYKNHTESLIDFKMLTFEEYLLEQGKENGVVAKMQGLRVCFMQRYVDEMLNYIDPILKVFSAEPEKKVEKKVIDIEDEILAEYKKRQNLEQEKPKETISYHPHNFLSLEVEIENIQLVVPQSSKSEEHILARVKSVRLGNKLIKQTEKRFVEDFRIVASFEAQTISEKGALPLIKVPEIEILAKLKYYKNTLHQVVNALTESIAIRFSPQQTEVLLKTMNGNLYEKGLVISAMDDKKLAVKQGKEKKVDDPFSGMALSNKVVEAIVEEPQQGYITKTTLDVKLNAAVIQVVKDVDQPTTDTIVLSTAFRGWVHIDEKGNQTITANLNKFSADQGVLGFDMEVSELLEQVKELGADGKIIQEFDAYVDMKTEQSPLLPGEQKSSIYVEVDKIDITFTYKTYSMFMRYLTVLQADLSAADAPEKKPVALIEEEKKEEKEDEQEEEEAEKEIVLENSHVSHGHQEILLKTGGLQITMINNAVNGVSIPFSRFYLNGKFGLQSFAQSQKISADLIIKGEYFNNQVVAWEPMFEKWAVKLELDQLGANSSTNITSDRVLNINLTRNMLDSISDSLKLINIGIEEQKEKNVEEKEIYAMYKVRNCTDIVLQYAMSKDSQPVILECNATDVLEFKEQKKQIVLKVEGSEQDIFVDIESKGTEIHVVKLGALRIIFCVTVVIENGMKIINLHSNTKIVNKTKIPIVVFERKILPGKEMWLPCKLTSPKFGFVPLIDGKGKYNETGSIDLIQNHDTNTFHVAAKSNEKGLPEVHFKVDFARTKVSVDNICTYEVNAPLLLENVLATSVVAAVGKHEVVIPRGGRTEVYCIPQGEQLKLKCIGLNDWTSKTTIDEKQKELEPMMLFNLTILVDRATDNSSLLLSFYVPYWIFDLTEVKLQWSENKDDLVCGSPGSFRRIVIDFQEEEKKKGENEELASMFNYTKKNKISIKTGDSDWSKPFKIESVGSLGQITMEGKNVEYHVGYSIEAGSGKYVRTKMITFRPRYIIVNKLPEAISLFQDGKKLKKIVAPEKNEVFHYPHKDLKKKLFFQLADQKDDDEDDWSKSGEFSLDTVGQVFMRLRREIDDTNMYVRLEVREDGPSLYIVINDQEETHIPYKIENRSVLDSVFIKQKGIDKVYKLRAGESSAFAWDEPLLAKKKEIVLQVEDSDKTETIQFTADRSAKRSTTLKGKDRQLYTYVISDRNTPKVLVISDFPEIPEDTNKKDAKLDALVKKIATQSRSDLLDHGKNMKKLQGIYEKRYAEIKKEGSPQLLVSVVNARGLVIANRMAGDTDSYCKVNIVENSKKKKVLRSEKSDTVKKSLNPDYNYRETFAVASLNDVNIEVEIWNGNFIGKDDFCGRIDIDNLAARFEKTKGKHVTIHASLKDNEKKGKLDISGKVLVRIEYYESDKALIEKKLVGFKNILKEQKKKLSQISRMYDRKKTQLLTLYNENEYKVNVKLYDYDMTLGKAVQQLVSPENIVGYRLLALVSLGKDTSLCILHENSKKKIRYGKAASDSKSVGTFFYVPVKKFSGSMCKIKCFVEMITLDKTKKKAMPQISYECLGEFDFPLQTLPVTEKKEEFDSKPIKKRKSRKKDEQKTEEPPLAILSGICDVSGGKLIYTAERTEPTLIIDRKISDTHIGLRGLGISMIDSTPKEVFYLNLEQFEFDFESSKSQHFLELKIHNMQFDDQARGFTANPVIFAPKPVPESQKKPFVHVSTSMVIGPQNYYYFPYASLLLQEMELKIEEEFIWTVLEFINDFFLDQIIGDDDEIVKRKDVLGVTDTMALPMYFALLQLHPIALELSFEANPNMRKKFGKLLFNPFSIVLNLAKGTIGSMSEVGLQINSLTIDDAFGTSDTLVYPIISHFVNQILRQFYVLLGSLDFIGNPAKLIDNLGDGVKDFFYKPMKGMVTSPKQFAFGLRDGTLSLVRNSVSGVFNAASKITSSLGKGVATLSMDEEYVRKRQMEQKKRKKPKHLGQGLLSGGKSLFGGIAKGIGGVFVDPVKGAKKGGAKGFFKGIGTGIMGVVAKPVVGVTEAVTETLDGISGTAQYLDFNKEDVKPNKRSRAPRIIEGGRLKEYDGEKAQLYAKIEPIFNELKEPFVVSFYEQNIKKQFIILTENHINFAARNGSLLKIYERKGAKVTITKEVVEIMGKEVNWKKNALGMQNKKEQTSTMKWSFMNEQAAKTVVGKIQN